MLWFGLTCSDHQAYQRRESFERKVLSQVEKCEMKTLAYLLPSFFRSVGKEEVLTLNVRLRNSFNCQKFNNLVIRMQSSAIS